MAEAKTSTTPMAKVAESKTAEPKAPGRRRITRRKANEALVRSYFEALAARDPRAAGEHWSDDGVEDVVALGVLRGRTAIEGLLRELYASSPDLETVPTRVLAGEREAAVEWRLRGTFDGAAFQGVEPTGKVIELRGFDLFEIEDGKIVSNTAYYDGADWARQVGLLPQQDSGAERALKNAFNTVTKLRRAIDERRSG